MEAHSQAKLGERDTESVEWTGGVDSSFSCAPKRRPFQKRRKYWDFQVVLEILRMKISSCRLLYH